MTTIGVPACLLGVVVCAAGSIWMLRGQLTLRQWIPPMLVLALQTVWFTLPLALNHFYATTGFVILDLGPRLFTYIAVSHAAQYLWITTYFARQSRGWDGHGLYWLKALAFGHAALLIPTLLAVKTPLAGISYDSGVAALTVTALNLHHFILDGAIWKLRSGWIAQILLRGQKGDESADAGPVPRWRKPAWIAVTVGLACTAILTAALSTNGVDFNIRAGNTDAAARALDSLDWVGRDSGIDRLSLAEAYLEQGRDDDADRQLTRSAALRNHPRTWLILAELRERQGRTEDALAAYDLALVAEPRWMTATKGAGLTAHRAGMHEETVRRLRPLVSANEADEETLAAYLASRRALVRREEDEGDAR